MRAHSSSEIALGAIEGAKNSMSIRNDERIINRRRRDDKRGERGSLESHDKSGKLNSQMRNIRNDQTETAKRLLKFLFLSPAFVGREREIAFIDDICRRPDIASC